jgi:hypothetical protein
MTTQELLDRTLQHLGIGQSTFWPSSELVTNCLNPAMRLVCLLKPDLLTLRTTVTQDIDAVLLDLRVVTPRLWRLQRLTLGDVTLTTPPTPSQGRLGDLRRISLTALRGQKDWFARQGPVPTHYYLHGLTLLGTWPRARRAVTLTFTYAALPVPLDVADLTREPDLPAQWHPLISDVAAALAVLKEGTSESQQGVQQLSQLVGEEPFKQLLKSFRAERYRQQAAAPQETASA